MEEDLIISVEYSAVEDAFRKLSMLTDETIKAHVEEYIKGLDNLFVDESSTGC